MRRVWEEYKGVVKALSVRIENIERRREDRSSKSSHGEDEGYEKDEEGRRNERYRERRNHRR